MRMLVASGIFHPEPGGPATYLRYLLPELQARGHTVTALSFGDTPTTGYPYCLTRIPRQNYLLRQWKYYQAASTLWPGHDLVYLHSLGLPLPAAARPRIAKIVGDIAWERAVNKGWIPAATDVDTFQLSRCGLLVEVDKTRRAQEARRLDHIIVPSQYLKNLVTGWGVDPRRVSVIYNALQPPHSLKLENRPEIRAKLGLPDQPVLLTVARLTAWKGIDHTLRALALLGSASIHFVVAGDGPKRQELEALAQKLGIAGQVSFLGRVAREKLPFYYQAADYKVLYSGYEGLSHVLLEALRSGTPVIASDKGGNPEVVKHGVNGLLVPYIDVDALASSIQQALAPGERERMAQQAHLDLERFDWNTMVSQTEAVLMQVAGQ